MDCSDPTRIPLHQPNNIPSPNHTDSLVTNLVGVISGLALGKLAALGAFFLTPILLPGISLGAWIGVTVLATGVCAIGAFFLAKKVATYIIRATSVPSTANHPKPMSSPSTKPSHTQNIDYNKNKPSSFPSTSAVAPKASPTSSAPISQSKSSIYDQFKDSLNQLEANIKALPENYSESIYTDLSNMLQQIEQLHNAGVLNRKEAGLIRLKIRSLETSLKFNGLRHEKILLENASNALNQLLQFSNKVAEEYPKIHAIITSRNIEAKCREATFKLHEAIEATKQAKVTENPTLLQIKAQLDSLEDKLKKEIQFTIDAYLQIVNLSEQIGSAIEQ